MKINEKKGIKQWFINKWNRSVDFDVDLTQEEEDIAFDVGIFLEPNESSKEKTIEAAIVYFIVLGMIREYNEGDKK